MNNSIRYNDWYWTQVIPVTCGCERHFKVICTHFERFCFVLFWWLFKLRSSNDQYSAGEPFLLLVAWRQSFSQQLSLSLYFTFSKHSVARRITMTMALIAKIDWCFSLFLGSTDFPNNHLLFGIYFWWRGWIFRSGAV